MRRIFNFFNRMLLKKIIEKQNRKIFFFVFCMKLNLFHSIVNISNVLLMIIHFRNTFYFKKKIFFSRDIEYYNNLILTTQILSKERPSKLKIIILNVTLKTNDTQVKNSS